MDALDLRLNDGQVPQAAKKWAVALAWTPRLAKTGHVPVVNAFLEHYSSLEPHALSTAEAMFVILLMKHKWNEEAPYPSYRRIARMMGVSDKMVRRYAANLEQKGYLVREAQQALPNRFDLRKLFAALEEALEIDRHARLSGKAAWRRGQRVEYAGTYSCKVCGESRYFNVGDLFPSRCNDDIPTAWFGPKPRIMERVASEMPAAPIIDDNE
jgi:hypothetical protein